MRASSIVEQLRFYYPILIECNLDWSPTPEHSESEKPARFYDSVLRVAEESWKDDTTIAVCIFSAGQKLKDSKFFQIRASYAIAVSHKRHEALKKADRKRLLEEFALGSAWPLFRVLFA